MRVLPMGPRAVLIEDLAAAPAAWAAGLVALDVDGLVDVVPAARTVLVTCSDDEAVTRLRERIGEVRPLDLGGAGERVIVPVAYDGDDLDAVADAVGLPRDEVVARHAAATYEVAFCGFAPGFGYLRGLPAELHLPRRDTPRTRVPAGAVAIAAEYSAIYPTASPGGWHLLGSSPIRLFDPDRDPPALLRPGTQVRFEPT